MWTCTYWLGHNPNEQVGKLDPNLATTVVLTVYTLVTIIGLTSQGQCTSQNYKHACTSVHQQHDKPS